MKNILTLVLVAIAIAGTIVAIKRNASESPDHETTSRAFTEKTDVNSAKAGSEQTHHQVKVTYFTTDVRCASCLKIEELTRQTVETQFAEELSEGKVAFQTINIEKPENRKFIQDYQLVSKTVVVANFRNGAQEDWVNLQDVWQNLHDESAFEAYIAQAITKFL